MGSVITYIVFILMCIMGGGSSIFVVLGIPAIVIWKIYRAVRYGKKLTD